jgi:hypothetical protein
MIHLTGTIGKATIMVGSRLSRPSRPLAFTPREGEASGRARSALEFLKLISGPLADKVMKCDRCRNYFLNTSGHRNKRFCGRQCATRESARVTMTRKRAAARASKLKALRMILADMLPENFRKPSWKKRVAHRAGITTNWLTRALQRGDVQIPFQIPQGQERGR